MTVLAYASEWPNRRSPLRIVVGVVSLLVGGGSFLACGLLYLLWLAGPLAPPDAPRPHDLSVFYTIDFFAFWVVAAWLAVASVCVFASQGPRPRRMLVVYVLAQLVTGLGWVALTVANDLNVAGRVPTDYIIKDSLESAAFTMTYPILLAPLLRSRMSIWRPPGPPGRR